MKNTLPPGLCGPVPFPRKVAIYTRVSTTMQADQYSLPMQRKDLIAYSELILGIADYEVFEDAGYSGKNTDRPAFQEMLRRLRAGEFSHLLVWKIDRISRNLLDFASLYQELQDLRVTFISKNEQFDTSNAVGEAMLKIILVFAELERNMTSERVTATMISRAAAGKWNGGRVPFGYSYDPDTETFSIVEDEAAVCRLLRDDYLEHKSLVHTARLLNTSGYTTRAGALWSPTAVWLIASSPWYAGIYRYNRYKGTENRTVNPEDEWVFVKNHHPAIFTEEDHEAMKSVLAVNTRQRQAPGRSHLARNVYVFGGLVYCGKCGSRMTSTPGRLLSSGLRTANHGCPRNRKAHDCDNAFVNDLIIGEFVINYVQNMLRAKTSFSKIDSPAALEALLLTGSTFRDIAHIEQDGLDKFFALLSRYKSDGSYSFSIKPRKKKVAADPEVEALFRERERQERALQRLQDLYLYSDASMSEKDFILRKEAITSSLQNVNKQLGMITRGAGGTLSDEEFVRQASHLLIAKDLTSKRYIYYRALAEAVAPDILKEYMSTILDAVYVTDGRVTSIIFRNGLTHRFIYRTPAAQPAELPPAARS